jgi:hypothetical protein
VGFDQKTYSKAYHLKNRDRILSQKREYAKGNRERINAYHREWEKTHKENIKRYNKNKKPYVYKSLEAKQFAERKTRLKKFGITPSEYDRLLSEQNGVCAICERAPKTRRLAVDHSHWAGRVRGILCFACNTFLEWHLKYSKKITSYLEKSGEPSMDINTEFGKRVWEELKPKIKDALEKWTPEEQLLVQQCAQDAAKIALMAAAGVDVKPEKAQIDAQLQNIKVAGEQAVTRTFWVVVAQILKVASAVLKG